MQKATIVQWPPETKRTGSSTSPGQNINFLSADFLGSSIRNETHACQKLHSVLGAYRTTDCQEPLLPLFRIENLINRFGMLLPSGWLAGVLIYLANSWTWEGEGLFARSTRRNLSKAMDFAIAQSVLPYVKDGIQAIDDLRISLKRILKSQFPSSASFIDGLASPVYNH